MVAVHGTRRQRQLLFGSVWNGWKPFRIGEERSMKAAILGTVVTALAAALCAGSVRAEEPILIGLIAGTTGAYGSTGVAVVNGAQLAVDKINAAGGVLGRQLKLDPHNDNASATLSGQLF